MIQIDGLNYNLARNKDGLIWQVEDQKLFPLMYTTDEPKSAQIPPIIEQTINHDYFYAGGGESVFEHLRRYYSSPGCDARVKGLVKLSPDIGKATITARAAPAATGAVNLGFETGDATGWTDLDAVGVEAGNFYVRTGTKSGQETVDIGANESFYQDLVFDPTWRGRSITVSAYYYAKQTDPFTASCKVGINDGVNTYWGTAVETENAWTQVTYTGVILPEATDLKIYAYSSCTNKETYFSWDDFVVTITDNDTAGDITAIEDYDGYPYAASGNRLLKYDGTDWDVIQAFPADITHLKTWGAYLFIALGHSNEYYYYDGTSFVENDIAASDMKFFSVVGATLYGNSSDYEIKASTNPVAGGSWAAATTIGNSNKVITSLLDHPDTVFVATTDCLYYLNSDGDVWAGVPDLYRENHAKTGRNLIFFKGCLYINSGYGALYEYEYSSGGGTVTTLTPKDSFPGQTDMDGFTCAMDGDDEYLYAMLDNGTKIEVVCGRWESIINQHGDYETNFFWHHILEQTLTATSDNVRVAKFSALPSSRRLWLGCAHTTDGIYYIDVDTNMEVAGSIISPWHEGIESHKNLPKSFYSVTLKTENLAATKTIVVSYKKEFDTSWVSLGTLTSGTSNTLYFKDITEYVTTRRLQLKFTFASNSTTTSPHLLSYALRYTCFPVGTVQNRITIDETGKFSEWGSFTTSWIHSAWREHDKNYYSMTLLSEGLTEAKTVSLEYKLDNETTYTYLPEVFTQSPSQTLFFPSETIGKVVKFDFTVSSPSDTDMNAYILNGEIRPRKRKAFDFAVEVADTQLSVNRGLVIDSSDESARDLRTIDENKWPVKLVTPDGYEHTIIIDSLVEQIPEIEEGKRPHYIFGVKAHEVDWEAT